MFWVWVLIAAAALGFFIFLYIFGGMATIFLYVALSFFSEHFKDFGEGLTHPIFIFAFWPVFLGYVFIYLLRNIFKR